MRFSIRDVLWLTVVVGLGAAWWVDHRHQDTKLRELAELAWNVLASKTDDPQVMRAIMQAKGN